MRRSSVVTHSIRFSPLDAVSCRLDPRYSNSTSIASTFFFALLDSDDRSSKEWLLTSNRGMFKLRMRRTVGNYYHLSVNKSIPFLKCCPIQYSCCRDFSSKTMATSTDQLPKILILGGNYIHSSEIMLRLCYD